jgi:hypothetical protein
MPSDFKEKHESTSRHIEKHMDKLEQEIGDLRLSLNMWLHKGAHSEAAAAARKMAELLTVLSVQEHTYSLLGHTR